MHNSIFLCVVVLVASHCGIEAALTTWPSNVAYITGKTFQLDCIADSETANLSIQWNYNAKNAAPVRIVYNCEVKPEFVGKYEVIKTAEGECSLLVLNADINAAGTYSCQNGFDQVSAVVVMLGSNSACFVTPNSNLIAGDFIRISCALNYNGAIAPRMRWRDNSTGFPISNATINTFPTQVNSFIDVPVYPPKARPYQCITFFDEDISFTYTYTLPTTYVQFPVENISPTVRVKYFEGASVVCKADGYPAPSYTWTNLDTDETSSGSTLSISVNGVGNYACEATNTIRGVTETIRTTVTTDIEEAYPTTTTTPEPTTTTTTPTTTTEAPVTTVTEKPETTVEPLNECGTSMSRVPLDEETPPTDWSLLCYISRDDTEYLATQCRDLITDLPSGYANSEELLQNNGTFGCSLTLRDDFLQAPQACQPEFQTTSVLESCPTCTRLFVCIQLP